MTAYEQYQLQWMIDHGHSLKNLMDELTEYQQEAIDCPAAPISDIFADWVKDSGFRGDLWACEQEWRDCENRYNTPQHVKFISYTGKWPNLCNGILTLEIDGVEHLFGYGSGQHEPFWTSGGKCWCWFSGDYSDPYVRTGSWETDASRLPEELKSYATEIDDVFNDNVDYCHCCCGGCL